MTLCNTMIGSEHITRFHHTLAPGSFNPQRVNNFRVLETRWRPATRVAHVDTRKYPGC